MQTQAIKLKQGWFIKDLPGFEEIKRDVINIDVDLADSEYQKLDYKELRGISIMERYFEKRQREIYEPAEITDLQVKFRQHFGISNRSFSVLVREL